jgi:hypothetical protein
MKFIMIFICLATNLALGESSMDHPMNIKERIRIEMLMEGLSEFNQEPLVPKIPLPIEVLKPLQELELSLKS